MSQLIQFGRGSAEQGVNPRLIHFVEKPKGFLIVHGPPGTGKTHFCAAMFRHFLERYKNIRAYKEPYLLGELRKRIDNMTGDYLYHLRSMIDDDGTIIDDLGASGHTPWRQEVLTDMVDFRYSTKLPTIITSNLDQTKIHNIYGFRIASRLFATENIIVDLNECRNFREDPI